MWAGLCCSVPGLLQWCICDPYLTPPPHDRGPPKSNCLSQRCPTTKPSLCPLARDTICACGRLAKQSIAPTHTHFRCGNVSCEWAPQEKLLVTRRPWSSPAEGSPDLAPVAFGSSCGPAAVLLTALGELTPCPPQCQTWAQ